MRTWISNFDFQSASRAITWLIELITAFDDVTGACERLVIWRTSRKTAQCKPKETLLANTSSSCKSKNQQQLSIRHGLSLTLVCLKFSCPELCSFVLRSFRHLQASTDTKASELRNEVKLRAFEAERLQIVYEESVRTLKECQLENEKLQKKLQVRS